MACEMLHNLLFVLEFSYNYLHPAIKASQMWCFARLLPLMIGELVPP